MIYILTGFILISNRSFEFVALFAALYLVSAYILFAFGSSFWSWLFFHIIIIFHHPREGIFPRDPHDKDYRAWSLRAVVKKYAIWVSHNFPFPWMDLLVFGHSEIDWVNRLQFSMDGLMQNF